MRRLEELRTTPIRKIKVVIDTEDILAPAFTIDDFERIFKKEPKPPRYRITVIEVLTCPEDGNVVLVAECSKCPRFVKRDGDKIYCSARPVK